MSDCWVTIFDTETTGLKAGYHEVIDLWVRRLLVSVEHEPDGTITYLDYATSGGSGGRIKPLHIDRSEPAALRVNGYTNDGWKNAETFPQVWRRVEDLFENSIWVGSNPAFDIRFLEAETERWSCSPLPKPVSIVNTATLAKPLKEAGAIPNCKMATLSKYFNADNTYNHNARGDVEATEKVYFALLRAELWRLNGKG